MRAEAGGLRGSKDWKIEMRQGSYAPGGGMGLVFFLDSTYFDNFYIFQGQFVIMESYQKAE